MRAPSDRAWPSAWPAPAKLNLFLHVVGRRADGFHELQSVFQFLEFGDRLRFAVRDDGAIARITGNAEFDAEQDLTVRAARLLQRRTGTPLGADIAIDKRLPIGGGLGGGSSDAATTLIALNALWGTGLDLDALAALGLELGADVPVFVRGRAAWGEGVGERLTPVEPPEPWYLVIDPGVRVATGEVFAAPDLTRNSAPITITDFLAGRTRNDCEPVVFARYPVIRAAADWLRGHAPARLTGTGACVFAAFETEAAAEAVRREVPAPWRGFVARGANRSPLHRVWEGIEAA